MHSHAPVMWVGSFHLILTVLRECFENHITLCLSKFGLCNELTGIGVRSSKDVWAWQSANIHQKGNKKRKQHVG